MFLCFDRLIRFPVSSRNQPSKRDLPVPDLVPLFWPRSILLVGASPDPTVIRGRIVAGLLRHGFDGPLHAVSRSHAEVAGIPCVPSIDEIPMTADLAIVTIPAEHVADALRSCGRKGVKAAVVISSGFKEEGGASGCARQEEIARIAREFDMAVIGPNAEGFLNARLPLAATFSPAVMNVEDGLLPAVSRARGIAVVSQSGGVGFSFFHRGRPKSLAFSFVVSTGNEAHLHAMDIAGYLLEDEGTSVIIAFLEGVRSPSMLLRIARRAAACKKPLIIAKVGRSEAAAAAAASHTASLAGSARVYDAVFDRHGIVHGEDQEQMVDTAAAFAFFAHCLPAGKRVGILTPSGGAGAWLADVCALHGLDVPPLDDAARADIDALLPAYGTSLNPVDVTAQVIFTVGYAPVLERMARSDAIDAILVAGSLSASTYIERDFDALCRLGASLDKPVIFCGYTRAAPEAVRLLAEAGFPCTTDMANAAKAIRAMADYREFLERFDREGEASEGEALGAEAPERTLAVPPGSPAAPSPSLSAGSDSIGGERLSASDAPSDALEMLGQGRRDEGSREYRGFVCEHDTKRLLRESLRGCAGVDIPGGILVEDAKAAVEAAHRTGFPVAIKIQSDDIPHKTEAGGVALNVADDEAVREAVERILGAAAAFAPEAVIRGVSVERMLAPGIEMIVGIDRDPDFGPILVAGAGGLLVELLDEVAVSPLPIDRAYALRMLRRLKVRRLLEGMRGAGPADIEALVGLMTAVADFASRAGETLESLDLNPVIVYPRGEGVVVADAVLQMRPVASIDGDG